METELISYSCLGHLPGSQSPLLSLLNQDSSGCSHADEAILDMLPCSWQIRARNGQQLCICQGGFRGFELKKDAGVSFGRNYAATLSEQMHSTVHRPLCGGIPQLCWHLSVGLTFALKGTPSQWLLHCFIFSTVIAADQLRRIGHKYPLSWNRGAEKENEAGEAHNFCLFWVNMKEKPVRLSPKTFCTILPEARARQFPMLWWILL